MSEPKKILIIEDNSLLRFSLAAFLEDSGFRCMHAEDGMEGLEIFSRCHPDLVLTDLRMPRLDGFGVLSALRECQPKRPVVVLTGSCDPETVAEVMALGAEACLQKPLTNTGVLVDLVWSLVGPVEAK